MYLLAALFLIVFEFSSEGFKARKWHIMSEWIEFVYRAVVTVVMFSWITWDVPRWLHYNPGHIIELLIGFIFLRFGIGDIIWNWCAGKGVTYIGFTKSYDNAVRWLFDKMEIPVGFFLWIRICSAITGAGLLLTI